MSHPSIHLYITFKKEKKMSIDINMKEYVDVVKKHFSEEDINVIMEIGSLDGKDSLFFKSNFPNAKVYAIEGLKENYDSYMKDLPGITCINMIITDFDGRIDFYKKRTNGIHGIFNRGNDFGTEIIKDMPCKTINTLCEEYNISNIDMIKIDVEGATYQVLKGMSKFLDNLKIMHIETESYPFFVGQTLHNEVCEFLNNHNFLILQCSSANIGDGKQHDSVWINKKYEQS